MYVPGMIISVMVSAIVVASCGRRMSMVSSSSPVRSTCTVLMIPSPPGGGVTRFSNVVSNTSGIISAASVPASIGCAGPRRRERQIEKAARAHRRPPGRRSARATALASVRASVALAAHSSACSSPLARVPVVVAHSSGAISAQVDVAADADWRFARRRHRHRRSSADSAAFAGRRRKMRSLAIVLEGRPRSIWTNLSTACKADTVGVHALVGVERQGSLQCACHVGMRSRLRSAFP